MKTGLCAALTALMIVSAHGQSTAPAMLGGRSLISAHNAYPEEGRWGDRITRALAVDARPIVIEQDVAFAANGAPGRQSVVSHDDQLDGSEPTLAAHFFERVRPIVEQAIAAGRKESWPVLVLHLDFKTNERAHHRAVWDLLRQYRSWLTTAPMSSQAGTISPFTPGPLLVLTENGEGQERDFTEWAAADGAYLLFGSIPAPVLKRSEDPNERARILVTATPQSLIATGPTSYRRWTNFSWSAVEEGGPTRAGEWTAGDEQRLTAIVNHAHQQGLLIRFYTLNGHSAANDRGFGASYNFGSIEAVQRRWRAAIKAGVDLIATDQYEDLARELRR